MWEPQPSETLRACAGFALPFALEIMFNGQTLCGIKVELAMFSTCTYDYEGHFINNAHYFFNYTYILFEAVSLYNPSM